MSLAQRPWSASTLSAFEACPRKVAWAWAEGQIWPRHEAAREGLAANLLGAKLHQLAEWQAKGFDVGPMLTQLESQAPDEAAALHKLWAAYLVRPEASASPSWPELHLQVPLGGGQVVAKLDRVIWEGDRFWVIDWKTGKLHPGLLEGWQAWLYPYALVEAGALLNQGQAIRPDQVGMRFVGLSTGGQLDLLHHSSRHEEARLRLETAFAALGAGLDADSAPALGLASGWCQASRCAFLPRCAPSSLQPKPIEWLGPAQPDDGEELAPSLGGAWAEDEEAGPPSGGWL